MQSKLISNINLVLTITKSTLKSRYRKTFAGFIWVVLSPIITFTVQALIFRHILRVDIQNYYLFLLSGVMPWIFITSTLSMTVTTFISQRSIMMAFKLDPWIFILAQAIDNLLNFIVSFVILLIINGELGVLYGIKIPLFFIMTFFLFVAVFFFSFLLATLSVFMRDIQFILGFVLNLAYFVTPIFYPRELIPSHLQWIVDYNPFYILIKPFRDIFIDFSTEVFYQDFTASLILQLGIAALALIVWNRKKNDIYFSL